MSANSNCISHTTLAVCLLAAPYTLILCTVYAVRPSRAASSLRCAAFMVSLLLSCSSTLFCSWSSSLLAYTSGIFSSWSIIWAAHTLLIESPFTMRRIQRHSDGYIWESMPEEYAIKRFYWSLDLCTNFRRIGWDTGTRKSATMDATTAMAKAQDLIAMGSDKQIAPVEFFQMHSVTLFRAYALLNVGQYLACIPTRVDLVVVLGMALAIYGISTCLHSIFALSAVGLIGPKHLGLAGQPLMYPPLYGHISHLRKFRFKDVWGKTWQNLFRQGYVSVASWLLPTSPPQVRLCLCFLFSAFMHAVASFSVTRNVCYIVPPALFFMLQPVGIVMQESVHASTSWLLRSRTRRLASYIIWHIDALTALLWMYNTFHVIVHDRGLRQAILQAPLTWATLSTVSKATYL